MRNVKINGRVAEDGSIILPPGVLESMCLNPGNLVTLEFAPTSPVKEANGYGPRFQVETGGCETDIIADEEEAALVVPHDLLNDAHIPMDTGLVVQTIPGAILIGDTDPMAAVQAPLLEILSLLGYLRRKRTRQSKKEGTTMSKPVYKVMDSKGRVLIPRELRLAAGMCGGDILALQLQEGKVSVRKVEIVEVGDQSPEAVEAYVRAAIKTMPDAVRLSLISDLSGLVREKEGSHVG